MQRRSRGEVALAYEERGAGDPPLVLIHGWCCDHGHFAPQAEHFSRRHRVVSVDLRGHGASDAPSGPYPMRSLADDVAWLARELGLHRPVLVGHSMGGLVALNLAVQHPELPAAIVLLDSPLLPPEGLLPDLPGTLAELKGPGHRAFQRQFVDEQLFLASDDPARRRRIVDEMSAAPQHVMASCFEEMFAFDHEAVAAACRVPMLYVAAENLLSDLGRLRSIRPEVVLGRTVGVGHFHQLEAPDQVNPMIERFLATRGLV
jgi:pimeloyl-ACP methyl ester carboxylesterase